MSASRVASLLLIVCLAACQRRDGIDERTFIDLGTGEDWQLATHPAVPLAPAEVEAVVRSVASATGRLVPLPTQHASADGALAARLRIRIAGVDASPGALVLRLVMTFRPPLGDEASLVVRSVSAQGLGSPAEAARSALEVAVSRGLDEIGALSQGRAKSDEELTGDLAGADPVRSRAALELLAVRRHPASFLPLVRQLHGDEALRALELLVTLDDPRAVRSIVEEADKRDLGFRVEAVHALGSLGGDDAEAYLFALESDPDARLRAAAAEALASSMRIAGARARARRLQIPTPQE